MCLLKIILLVMYTGLLAAASVSCFITAYYNFKSKDYIATFFLLFLSVFILVLTITFINEI